MFDFFIIATPIGNFEDITLRAVKILKKVDFIVCEEEREYRKLFSNLKIKEKKYVLCNEHNESDAIDLVIPLLKNGEKGALISDCGTPIFEDPGFKLIETIRKNKFKVTSIPGANSLILSLSLSPFEIKNFYYNGFLPKKTDEREKEIIKILNRNEAIVLIESPYRLKNILELLKKNILHSRDIFNPGCFYTYFNSVTATRDCRVF